MKNILIDFGGTISRDSDLFRQIAVKSCNFTPIDFHPDFWDKIETVGSVNYFDSVKSNFFDMCEFYCGFENFVRKFNSKNPNSDTKTIVVFDNKPNIKIASDQIQFLLAKKLMEENCSPNAIYVESDKLSLCKKLGVDIAIEDDPRVALALAAANIKTFLISRIWNRKFDLSIVDLVVSVKKKEIIQKNLTVVEDWVEVSQLLVV